MEKSLSIRYHSKKIFLLIGLLVLGVTLIQLADAALAQGTERPSRSDGQRLMSVYDKGVEKTIITRAKTVREALKAARIEVDERRDVVEPALNEELVASSYNVNIFRARPVTVVDGQARIRLTTAEQTPAAIAEAAGIKLYSEDIVDIHAAENVVASGTNAVLTIKRATPLQLNLYGSLAEVRTHAKTVGALLKEKHVQLASNDTVSLPLEAPITSGMRLDVWRNGKQTITTDEDVAFPVETVRDANRETGHKEVKEAGEKGRRTVTYEIEVQNGKEVSRREIASQVIKQPKKQVEIIGTKNAAMPYTGGGNKDQWLSSSNIPRDQWGYAEWLVQKESGWNPNARNQSGACGLAQALPCSKVPGNPLNPVDSLNWMHGYVMGRYGSWEKAVAHSKARGWY